MFINASLIVQMIVFLILVGFTMKYVWPPIVKALDERAAKIAAGLSAADKAKAELAGAEAQIAKELAQTKAESGKLISDAEKRAARHRRRRQGSRRRRRRQDPGRRQGPMPSSRSPVPVKPCASRSPRWPSRVPSRSCRRKSTPASTPSCWLA